MKNQIPTHPAPSSRVVELRARTFREGDRHVARCDALGISDHGASEEEALENLGKTIALFFISGIRRGTIERYLQARGIVSVSVVPNSAAAESGGGEIVYVPLLRVA